MLAPAGTLTGAGPAPASLRVLDALHPASSAAHVAARKMAFVLVCMAETPGQ
jgi:hypothetical protein